MDFKKYRPAAQMIMKDRKWPNNQITKAPLWCSVDLRDGNQALQIPMTLEQKLNFFKLLVDLGFKEIEIGFPAASDTEFMFTRTLIEQNLIPQDVVIQVLTQSRDHIIKKTFEALEGVHKAVVHLYNSTSVLQRDVVFNKSKEEIVELAVFGANLINELSNQYGRERFIFEYSPESFTGTEVDFAAEICNAVLDVWKPTAERKAIINLPATVEMTTPNVYADQIEYMCNHIKNRENVIISLHTHNDRGTSVAATELGLLAGADRVEGTLFGNGERTGNVDIMNVALNMYAQAIDPLLDFSKVNDIIKVYEQSTGLVVNPRHPYAGELVFTAFSGSHQDAINKGLQRLKEKYEYWEVPYLHIDPADLGRSYDPIIRINSQSGKGGVAYLLQQNYGLQIPKKMQQDFGTKVTKASDTANKELLADELYEMFKQEYMNTNGELKLISFSEETKDSESITIQSIVESKGEQITFKEEGNGLIEAFCLGLKNTFHLDFEITNYSQHSLEHGSSSRAITYIEISTKNGKTYFGAGISSSVSKSSLRALVNAVNNIQ